MPALAGKVAIITGAGSPRGQGAAEAAMFSAEGAEAGIVADLATSDGEVVAAGLGRVGSFAMLDVTDADAWRVLADAVVREFGRIDCLVNNAGIWLAKGVLDTSPEEYRRVIAVNQTGVFLGMWAVAPHMRAARQGTIVNIS